MPKYLRQITEKNWIQNAIKKPGALTRAAHKAKKSVGEFAQEHKHSSGKVGQRARLALTLKKMHEEEQLDELSKGYDSPISRYANKARRSVRYDETQRRPKLLKKIGSTGSVPSSPRPGTNPELDKLDRKIARRHWGIKKAEAQIRKHGREVEASAEYERTKGAKTFTYKPKVIKSKWSLKEENELNELSQRTLGSYTKLAAHSLSDASWREGIAKPGALQKFAHKAQKRETGINRAADRLMGKYKTKKRDQSNPYSDKKYREYRAEETLVEADTISLTVPLFIRMLEYAKEDAKTDMDLHKATENILSLSDGDTLDMDSYEDIVNEEKKQEETELDEAIRSAYKRKGPSRPIIKTRAQLAKEKAERNRTLRAAVRDMKKTGQKPQIGVRGNQRTWKAARKSARSD